MFQLFWFALGFFFPGKSWFQIAARVENFEKLEVLLNKYFFLGWENLVFCLSWTLFLFLLSSSKKKFQYATFLGIKWNVHHGFIRTSWIKLEVRMSLHLCILGNPWDILQKNVPLLKLLIQKLNPYWYMETDSYSYVPYDL